MAGGRIEIYRLIQGLVSHGHNISLITSGDEDLIEEMKSEVSVSVINVRHDSGVSVDQYAKNILTSDPLPIMNFRSGPFDTELENAIGENDFDIVHLHTLQMSFLAEGVPSDLPTVIRFTNIKSEIYRQFARRTANPFKTAYAYMQYKKTKIFEQNITQFADITLTITEDDQKFLENLNVKGKIETLPAGIDIDAFSNFEFSRNDGNIIMFFGSMDYHPNEDAALWLAEDIWPIIKEDSGNCTLELVGKSPSEELEQLSDDRDITVTGYVDDIQEWVDRASVIVIPIRVGTGVRIKILHAMAMGKPIVTTSTGIKGINAEDGVEVLIRDSPDEIATAVVNLIDCPDQREQLGLNARSFVEKEYSYESVSRKLESIYQNII